MKPNVTKTQCRAGVLALVVWAFTPNAYADPKVDAEALFLEGMRLVQAGRFEQACPKLAESLKLDPALGTQFRLAECYESLGKTATAWSLFRETASKANAAKLAAQAGKALARADALESKLAKVSIVVSPEMAKWRGLSMTRDGESVGSASWNVPMPMDPGKYVFVVEAPGKQPARLVVDVAPLENKTIDIPRLRDVVVPKPSPVPGIATLGLGAGVLAAGAVFGGLSLKQNGMWRREFDAHCDPVTRDCDQPSIAGLRAIESKRDTYATLSTVGIVAGTTIAATGVLLWIAPWRKNAGDVSVSFVGPGGPGMTLRGSF